MRTPSSDPQSPRRFPAYTTLALCAALGVVGCNKDDAKPEADTPAAEGGADDTKDQEKDKAGDGGLGSKAAKAVDATIADSLSPADALQRGDVLGHFLLPNPLGFLDEIKNKAAPPMAAMFLQEATLRSAAAAQLGSRAGVAEHLALDKPLGCVVVDSTVTEVPVACMMGYTGGAKALATDLGEQGKQADAGGHVAHYQVEGEEIYLDDLGDMIVVSNHAEVFDKAKPYIEKNLIARAGEIINDFEAVAFVGAGMKRYDKELRPLLDTMSEVPMPTEDNPFVKAMATYSREASAQSMKRYEETEQATIGLSLEEAGFVMRWAWFATPGSSYEAELAAFAGGPLDLGFVSKLPAATWAFGAYRFDDKVEEVETLKELREVMVDAYAEATKKDAATVNKALEEFYKESTEIYGPDFAMAVMHLPGTYGGLVFEIPLEEGKSGRDRWKKLSESFTPENVLPADAQKDVTWSFTPDAAKVGSATVDRWVIEPTAKGKKEIASAGSEVQEWDKKLGGIRLTIDRVEVDGRALFVATAGDPTAYTQAAVDAVRGKGALGDDAGFKAITGRVGSKGVSSFGGINVQGGAQWMKTVLPPEAAGQIPPTVGVDLSDITMVASYSKKGSAMTGEIVLSQPFMDALRALVK